MTPARHIADVKNEKHLTQAIVCVHRENEKTGIEAKITYRWHISVVPSRYVHSK